MRKNIALLVLLVGTSAAQLFAAVTSTVAYVNYNGSDKAACNGGAPCKAITQALTVVPAGGVVDIVGSGAYDTFASSLSMPTSVRLTTVGRSDSQIQPTVSQFRTNSHRLDLGSQLKATRSSGHSSRIASLSSILRITALGNVATRRHSVSTKSRRTERRVTRTFRPSNLNPVTQ